MTDAEIAIERLTAWVRDCGNAKPDAFVGDISMLLVIAKGAVNKKEPDMLPCPFCGSDNLEICVYYVAYRECGCQGPLVDVYTGPIPRREQVIDAWNKRVAT